MLLYHYLTTDILDIPLGLDREAWQAAGELLPERFPTDWAATVAL